MHTHAHRRTHVRMHAHIPYTWCANSSFPIEAQRVLLILESLSSKKRYKCVPWSGSVWHPVSPWSDRKFTLSLLHSAWSSTTKDSFILFIFKDLCLQKSLLLWKNKQLGKKLWVPSASGDRKDLQEKGGLVRRRGKRATHSLVSCPICLGCRRGEKFHLFHSTSMDWVLIVCQGSCQALGILWQAKPAGSCLCGAMVHLQEGGEKWTPKKSH